MSKILVLTVLIAAVVCKPSYAELFKYADEKGNIHITDNLDAVPEAQRPRYRSADIQDHESPRGKTGETSRSSVASGKRSGPAAPLSSSQAGTLPEKNDTSLNIIVQRSSAASSADLSKLPPEYKDQFKDIMNSSSIPPEGSTASCSEFKSGLNKDMDKIMQTIRALAAEKKKGELGILAKAKGVWTLKSVGWVVFRMMNGQEQCVKEFEKENEARFEAMTKEINALTEEVKDK
jgi:hypothetical protein